MMNNLKSLYGNEWRKVLVLSATFLCLVFTIISCKKDKKTIGEGALPPGTTLESAGVDTFSLRTYSISVDSVPSTNPQFNLVGKYNDPEVGVVEAGFFTQLQMASTNTDFGDFGDITIDSVVLSFNYGGYYGTPTEQLFEVYELDADLSPDSTYYQFSTVPTKLDNLVPTGNNEGLITPKPLEQSVVGNDTVEPQLRIPLDHNFGMNLLQLANGESDNENFKQQFKGLNVKVNVPTPMAGQGSILYLASANAASKLTVYFQVAGESDPTTYDFLITNQLIDFNHVETDPTGSNLEQVLNDTIMGQQSYFAQAFNARAKIEFPTIENIPENAILHDATLELPISYFSGSDFYPSTNVTIGAKLFPDDDQIFLILNSVPYNQQRRAYIFNLRPYIQNILNGDVINDGIILSPRFFNTSAERMVFNGPQTSNKSKPRLNVVYTEF